LRFSKSEARQALLLAQKHDAYFPQGSSFLTDAAKMRARALSPWRGRKKEIETSIKAGLDDTTDRTQRKVLLMSVSSDLAYLALVDRQTALPYLPFLIRILRHEDLDVVNDATVAIGLYGPHAKSAVPALIRAYERVKGNDVYSWRPLEALGRTGDLRARPLLLAALPQTGLKTGWRSALVARLYLCSSAFVSKDLYLKHLKRPDKQVRMAMVLVMEYLTRNTAWAAPALSEMTKDDDLEVRALAKEAATRARCRAMKHHPQ